MTVSTRQSQGGMTALGFLVIAVLVGIVGLAALKVTPMYIKGMRMSTIMADIESEMSGNSPTPATIRQELGRRFSIEDINLDVNALKITQSRNGFTLQISYEERAPYVADIYLLVAFDKSVEIRR